MRRGAGCESQLATHVGIVHARSSLLVMVFMQNWFRCRLRTRKPSSQPNKLKGKKKTVERQSAHPPLACADVLSRHVSYDCLGASTRRFGIRTRRTQINGNIWKYHSDDRVTITAHIAKKNHVLLYKRGRRRRQIMCVEICARKLICADLASG